MESRADFREREGLILSQCRLESGLSQEYVARQMDVNIQQAALVQARHLSDIIRKCLVYLLVRPVWSIGIAECRRHPDALQPAPGGLFADGEPHQQIIASDRGKPFFPVAHRAYILCGAHGSDWAGQIDLLCANAHTSMQSRVRVCQAVIQNYRIDTVTGDDPCPESIKPDFDRLQICLQAGEAAVLAGDGEYNAREK